MPHHPQKRPRIAAVVAAALLVLAACNALVGIDEPTLSQRPANGALACLRTSDCKTPGDVCLFQVCSFPCAADSDCGVGLRCLKTAAERACVTSSAAQCDPKGPTVCPEGTRCGIEGQCRNDCASGEGCLAGQTCNAEGLCVGTDAQRDPQNLGSGGAPGAAGAGGQGAVPVGGAAGMAGMSGSAGAPSGGAPPVGSPCTMEAAIRCEGSAQLARSVCTAGVWAAAESCTGGQLCDRGTGECKDVVAACVGRQPGEAVCTGVTRTVCGPDLVSSTSKACTTAQHCEQGQGPDCATCLTGEHTCSGEMLQICNAAHDGFAPVEMCTQAPCNATLGRCTNLICDPGTYSCDLGTNSLQLCNTDGTAFASTTPCGANTCDAVGGQCDTCVPNQATGCVGSAQKSVCATDGQSASPVLCSSVDAAKPLCVGQGECVQCADATACQPQNDCYTATCNSWTCGQTFRGQHQPCSGGFCDSGGTCRTCTQSAGQCGGGMPVCLNNGCVACTPNPTPSLCADSNTPQYCNANGAWQNASDCSGGTPACLNGACVACAPNPTPSLCLDSNTPQFCNANGAWQNATDCSGGMPACLNGACVQCSPNPTPTQCAVPLICTKTPQYCNSAGSWVSSAQCTTGNICSSGSCVTAPEYGIGQFAQLATSTSEAPGYMVATKINIGCRISLKRFGLFARPDTTPAQVKFALYRDNGNTPVGGSLVAASLALALPVAGGTVEPPVSPSAVMIDAGAYWIVSKFDTSALTYYTAGVGQAHYIAHAFALGWPTPFPAGASASANTFNYYIEGTDSP